MMQDNNISILPSALAAVVALAVLACFLMFVDIAAIAQRFAAIGFLGMAGIALMVGFFTLGSETATRMHSKVFLRAGVAGALVLHFCATAVVVFLAGLFSLETFVLILSTMAAITVVVVFGIIAFSRSIAADDRKATGARMFMDDCQARMSALCADGRYAAHKPRLAAICEQIKYADKFGASDEDFRIEAALCRLETAVSQDEDGAVDATLDEITKLLDMRKAQMTQIKRGGF